MSKHWSIVLQTNTTWHVTLLTAGVGGEMWENLKWDDGDDGGGLHVVNIINFISTDALLPALACGHTYGQPD